MPKIAFVGQPSYFRGHYADMLINPPEGYEAIEVPFTFMVSNPESTLMGLTADVIYLFRGELIPLQVLKSMKGIKVHLSTEPMPFDGQNGNVEISPDRSQRAWELTGNREGFDHIYHFDKASISFLERQKFKIEGDFYLPISKTVFHPEGQDGDVATWDVLFYAKDTTHRSAMTANLKHIMGERFCHIAHGFVGEELNRIAAKSLIGLNVHVDGIPTMEPRIQQMMAMGLCVFSEPISHHDLFKPGVHFVEFSGPQDLWGKVNYYLNEAAEERQQIAEAGYALVTEKLDAVTEWKRFTDMILAGRAYTAPKLLEVRHHNKPRHSR